MVRDVRVVLSEFCDKSRVFYFFLEGCGWVFRWRVFCVVRLLGVLDLVFLLVVWRMLFVSLFLLGDIYYVVVFILRYGMFRFRCYVAVVVFSGRWEFG